MSLFDLPRLRRHALAGGALLALVVPVAALELSGADELIPTVTPAGATAPFSASTACTPMNDGWESYGTFVGAMHEHSGYSDGWPGTRPADYFAQIKARGFDFAGSAEHSDNARVPVTLNEECLALDQQACSDALTACGADPAQCESALHACVPCVQTGTDGVTKWEQTAEQARAASDASFTAFRGFEWTSDHFGHINVFFSKNDANAKTDGGYVTLESFWEWFTTRAEHGGGVDGLATFNHPGREHVLADGEPGYNWNDFAFVPDADLRMVGIEVFNRGRDYGTKNDDVPEGAPGWYVHALDKGWHLGPVGAEDEHNTDWGGSGTGKTVLLARDRSAPALREALLARRFYAVGPQHNDLRLTYTIDGQPMGARLARPSGARLRLYFSITAGVQDARVQLVTNGGAVVAETAGTLQRWINVTESAERWYFVRVVDKKNGNPIAYTAPIWVRAGGPYPLCGEWLAGDLHVHTTYSGDSWDGSLEDEPGPQEFWTFGHSVDRQFRIAATRGLDYLAITDHNDVRSIADFPAMAHYGVVPVSGYENSLDGHAQILGPDLVYEANTDPVMRKRCGVDNTTQAGVTRLRDCVRADGGVFQINHPALGSVAFPADADWELARPPLLYDGDVVPDTVEIWNISWLYKPPLPSASALDDAVRYWEGWLNRDARVAATGGSDNHWVTTTAVQGNGQPTTWVFATERSERGVLDGLRRGRTTITHQPPLLPSPRVVIEADRDGDGVLYEAMLGDAVPVTAALRVRVSDAAGGFLRVIGSGGVIRSDPMPIMARDFEVVFQAPAGTRWLRAEVVEPDGAAERASVCADEHLNFLDPVTGRTTYCRDRLAVLAMSSALYLE